MIFLNSNFKDNLEETFSLVENEKKFITYNINIQKKLKDVILNYMQNFATSTDSIALNSVNCVYDFLDILKKSLNLCNENICTLNDLIFKFENLITSLKNDDVNLVVLLNSFNSEYYNSIKLVCEATLKIQESICSISKNSEFKFDTPSSVGSPRIESQEKLSDDNIPLAENTDDETNFVENTLIVSESSKKVILPYQISKIKKIYENHTEDYSSLEDVVDKKYTIPISNYKNAVISRFKETFKLMRTREKSSIAEAFELAFELMFNYNLHPAIISACQNLDELDIYLDYLESGETNKFKCFKVLFELPPIAVKN